MRRLKALAVNGQNICINRVKFLEMGQHREEPVTSFVARLQGGSNLCSFTVKCSSFSRDTSYQEAIMAHQLVRALVEPKIQERVMSEYGNKKDVSLSELAEYVETQEMGK